MSALDELLDFDSRQSAGCSRRNTEAREELAQLRDVAEAAREVPAALDDVIEFVKSVTQNAELAATRTAHLRAMRDKLAAALDAAERGKS